MCEKTCYLLLFAASLAACASGAGTRGGSDSAADSAAEDSVMESRQLFDADSAYSYTARQVEFGPRVPNSAAHTAAQKWLAAELKRHGAVVTLQEADLKAFDGTILHAVNIFGQINPDAEERLLLLAHYDTRPWADEDPDPALRRSPADGANDGASGVAVILETARQLKKAGFKGGVDFLLVDAEDYGQESNDESWAMGTRYFAQNPPVAGYRPARAILLDMVGGKDAVFPAEYFSRQAAPELDDAFRRAARKAGHADRFPAVYGSGVTDDHIELIKVGIPAIDIIDYRPETGFAPTWHTHADNLENIDRTTLRAVGESLLQFIISN
ncbi:MAG: M20/M25/M40 family metallo-hydrolase [Muribaculaceae bacterium]|nr:M20/M25/M40 family metallo-hydrolase [Muribaculaceae bacterium]